MTRFPRILSLHWLVAALALATVLPTASAWSESASSVTLPRPAGLAGDVDFWVRIYSEVTTAGGLIHDSRNLEVVYQKVTTPKGLSRKAKERWTDKVKDKYRKILSTLATGKRSGLTSEEARILALWPDNVSNSELRKAKSRLRFQLGQADKFEAGIVRSGRWKSFIEGIFEEHGLPRELASLPHVESSFTPWAYSHVGAAGLWQFTRSTGQRFLRVDHVADERLDPYRATVAAARLLKQNREVTGTWPLAITAYNHGASGMRRAARKLGTKDIVRINREYKSRTFGFASRNFYPELLAASEVASNYERYFGKLTLDTPPDLATFEVPFFTTPDALCKALGVDLASFKEANPSLREAVWRGSKYIPRKFPLHIANDQMSRPMKLALDSVPKAQRHAAQTRDINYQVRKGDSLSTIARKFKVSVSELVAINGLRSRHRIRIGQKLKLPDDGKSAPVARGPVERSAVPASGMYTVRRGDTISRIATRFGLAEADIMAANRLRNRNRIYVGQTIALSKKAAQPQPAAKKEPNPVVVAAVAKMPKPIRKATVVEDVVDLLVDPVVNVAVDVVADVTIEDAELIESPAVDPAAQEEVAADLPPLLADPSEYGVAQNNSIEVQGAETLGHYADWLGIPTNTLRRLNKLPYGRAISIGQQIRLDFNKRDVAAFEALRQDFHRELQEAFFERYEIEGTRTHVARRGDSIWKLAEKEYNIPLWLLRQYNPDLDFAALRKGTRIQVPELKQRESFLQQQAALALRAS